MKPIPKRYIIAAVIVIGYLNGALTSTLTK